MSLRRKICPQHGHIPNIFLCSSFKGIGVSYILVLIFKDVMGFAIESLILSPVSFGGAIFTGILVAVVSGLWPLILILRMPVISNLHTSLQRKQSEVYLIGRPPLLSGYL